MAIGQVSFFADMDKLEIQTEDLAYGVKSEMVFQTTSCFIAKEGCKAYAITKCLVVVVRQVRGQNGGFVNVILKPIDTMCLNLPVKYFILRGLKSDSFFTADGNVKKDSGQDVSGFLRQMWQIQRKRLGDGHDVAINADVLTYGTEGDAVSDDAPVDDLFDADNNIVGGQPYPVERGVDLGVFGVNAGIDVILEGDYSPRIADVRPQSYRIELSEKNAIDDVVARYRKETVLNYVDASAFFSMHDMDNSLFFTKDRLYIDIRDRFDNSYNYHSPQDRKQIKINSAAAMPCETSGWPLCVLQEPATALSVEIGVVQCHHCSLFIQHVEQVNNNIDDNNGTFYIRYDGLAIQNGYTPAVSLELATSSSLVKIVVLPYVEEEVVPFMSGSLLDYCIEPLEVQHYSGQLRAWNVVNRLKYTADRNRSLSVETGVIRDRIVSTGGQEAEMFLYYVRPVAYFEPADATVRNDFHPSHNDTNAEYKSAFEQFNALYVAKVVQGTEDSGLTPFMYDRGNGDFVYLIGISSDEQASLLEALRSFSHYHTVTFVFKPTESVAPCGCQSYEMRLAGYDAGGSYMEKSCGNNGICLYSADGMIYTSEAFLYGYPTLRQEQYYVHFVLSDDYEQMCWFGFDWMRDYYKDTCVGVNIDGQYYEDAAMAYEELKKEYLPVLRDDKYMTLYNGGYYVPWLVLHTGDEAVLQLSINAGKSYIERVGHKIRFVFPSALHIELEQHGIVGSTEFFAPNDLYNERIKIKNTSNLLTDGIIGLINENGDAVGALNIRKTLPMKDLKVQFISVSFNGILKCKDGTEIVLNDLQKPDDSYGERNYNEWISWAKGGNIEATGNYMAQAGVNVQNTVDITANRNTTPGKFRFNFFDKHLIVNFSLMNTTCLNKDGKPLKIEINNTFIKTLCTSICCEVQTTEGKALACDTRLLFNTLVFCADDRLDIDPTEIYVYLCPVKIINVTSVGKYEDESGFYLKDKFTIDGTKEIHRDGVILCGSPKYLKKQVLAHELAHQQSLEHAFLDNDERDKKKKFIFTSKSTDNIMDYDDAENSHKYFWKWQIDDIHKSNKID